jgi:hypothetical protein
MKTFQHSAADSSSPAPAARPQLARLAAPLGALCIAIALTALSHLLDLHGVLWVARACFQAARFGRLLAGCRRDWRDLLLDALL